MLGTPLSDGALLLRLPEPGDVAAIVAACQDPEIPRWTLVPSPYTEADALTWIPEAWRQAREGTGLHLLVVEEIGERLLGSAGLVTLDLTAGYGEIGYWLAADARGHGVTTRAVALLRDHAHAREGLGLGTVEIVCHRDNSASRRVAERAGFRATGERRPGPRGEGREHVAYVSRRSAA